MKRSLISILFATLLFPIASSAKADVSVTALMSKHNVSWTEAIGAALLADALGIDATFVVSTGRRMGVSVYDLAPAIVIHQHSGRDIAYIWEMNKKKKKGWGVIAHELGIHPGVFNKNRQWLMSARDDEFVSAIWIHSMHRATGFPVNTIAAWRARGLDLPGTVATVHIAYATKQPAPVVITQWQRTRDWNKVRGHFGLPADLKPGHVLKKLPGNQKPPAVAGKGGKLPPGKAGDKAKDKGKGKRR